MEDIAPALHEAIQADFNKLVAEDRTIAAILKKIEAGTATHADTQQYAIRIGAHAATALKRNLTEGLLPDGQLYYNIAERTIRPALEHNLELVNAVASHVQTALNEAAGIGIKPISATLDDDRIHRIVSSAADTPTITAMHGWLGEAVVNTTQSFADEFIRANAEFHYQSGLSPKIVRTSTGKCCDWCNSLAGTYDYEDARENGVFRRHDYCRCVVDFYSKKGERETVHTGTEGKRKYVRSGVSGKYYLTDEADQARKIAHRKEMEATAKERAKVAREKRIATWAKKKQGDLDEAKRIEVRKQIRGRDDSPLRHPVNPVTGERYRYHALSVTDKQFGKKAGKHAHEFGLSEKSPADRDKLLKMIADIAENADERCYGEWMSQESPVLFHIKGDDVVVESKYGDFITILKGGTSNERVKRARQR